MYIGRIRDSNLVTPYNPPIGFSLFPTIGGFSFFRGVIDGE